MNAGYVKKDISLILWSVAQVKLFKSILECFVQDCAECSPIIGTCYYCMQGGKLIREPTIPFRQQCKSN